MQISNINSNYKTYKLHFGTKNLSARTNVVQSVSDAFEKDETNKKRNSLFKKITSVFQKELKKIQSKINIIPKEDFKLPEYVEFEPVQNIKEAQVFAKEKFNIKDFEVQNPQIANFALEGLSQVVNKTKGNIKIPDSIIEIKGNIFWQEAVSDRTLFINSEVTPIEYFIYCVPYTKKDFLEKYKNADFLERINMLFNYEKDRGVLEKSKFHTLFHEVGHINHKYQNSDKFQKYFTSTSYDEDDNYYKNLENNPVIMNHTKKCQNLSEEEKVLIGDYALIYPAEFVADIYAYMMSGKNFSKNLMKIYNTYGGPKINQ